MLLGLIYEDRGRMEEAISAFAHPGMLSRLKPQEHRPFFSSDVVALTSKIEEALPRSQPVPASAAMLMSPELEEVFAKAAAVRRSHRRRLIAPLHFLTAMLADESSRSAQLLGQAGITHESVMQAITRGDDKVRGIIRWWPF